MALKWKVFQSLYYPVPVCGDFSYTAGCSHLAHFIFHKLQAYREIFSVTSAAIKIAYIISVRKEKS